MVQIQAFQAGHAGSIPVTRSEEVLPQRQGSVAAQRISTNDVASQMSTKTLK
jgi:hypothetical protein